jgi:RNA polymerase sigma-70 factor (ECF subfamily)
MTQVAEKHSSAIDDAVSRLLSRAGDARGLAANDLRPRVDSALGKYLFKENANPEHNDIKTFVDEIRADDLCLIIACEKGDEKAWEDLVANFDSTVKSAARKISSNNEDAEDLASGIWAELYGLRQDVDGNKKSKLAYYSGRGSLAGWLRAVVSQLAIDQFRKQSKFVQIEETREFENLAEESSNHSGNINVLHHTESPEELLSEKQTSDDVASALQRAIAGLEDEDRLIMKLYYFDDLKLKDIAATFDYHEATASRKLVRVQSEIRKSVEKELKKTHGWSDGEVKRYLSETASKLGVNLEQMFAILITLAMVQDFLA